MHRAHDSRGQSESCGTWLQLGSSIKLASPQPTADAGSAGAQTMIQSGAPADEPTDWRSSGCFFSGWAVAACRRAGGIASDRKPDSRGTRSCPAILTSLGSSDAPIWAVSAPVSPVVSTNSGLASPSTSSDLTTQSDEIDSARAALLARLPPPFKRIERAAMSRCRRDAKTC